MHNVCIDLNILVVVRYVEQDAALMMELVHTCIAETIFKFTDLGLPVPNIKGIHSYIPFTYM